MDIGTRRYVAHKLAPGQGHRYQAEERVPKAGTIICSIGDRGLGILK